MSKRDDPRQIQALNAITIAGFDLQGVKLYHTPSGGRYVAEGVTIREHDLVPCILYSAESDPLKVRWCRPVSEFFWNGMDDHTHVKWMWSRVDDGLMLKLRQLSRIIVRELWNDPKHWPVREQE